MDYCAILHIHALSKFLNPDKADQYPYHILAIERDLS